MTPTNSRNTTKLGAILGFTINSSKEKQLSILGKEEKRIQRDKKSLLELERWRVCLCTSVPYYRMIRKTCFVELFLITLKNFLGVIWYYNNSRFIPGMFMRVTVSAQHKEEWIFRRMPNDEGIFGCCLCWSCQLQNNYVFISPCVCSIHMLI